MASGAISAIELGSLSPNRSSTATTASDSNLIPLRPSSSQDEQLQIGTGYAVPYSFYLMAHPPSPRMAYGEPYPGQHSYYPTNNNVPSDKKYDVEFCKPIIACCMIIIFLFVLVHFADNPKLKCPSISIASATLTAFTLSNSSTTVSSDFTLTFFLQNPDNDKGVSYHLIQADVLYGIEVIGSSSLPRFDQDAKSDTVMVARITQSNNPVLASTVKGINEDLINDGVVEFSVNLHAMMSFSRVMGNVTELKARCPGVKIQFLNGTTNYAGTFTGPSIICNIKSSDEM